MQCNGVNVLRNFRSFVIVCGVLIVVGVVAGCADREAAAEEPVAPEASSAPAAAAAGGGQAPTTPTADVQKRVVSGEIQLAAADVRKSSDAIREKVLQLGGRIVDDRVTSSGDRSSTDHKITVRLPPNQVDPLVKHIATLGEIVSQRVSAADVSREYFDRDIALNNQRLTLQRLQSLLNRPDVRMQEILEIEKELTRVRGEIDKLEGARRFQDDQIAHATLSISIEDAARAQQYSREVSSRVFRIGPRLSVLQLGDGEEQRQSVGLTLSWGKSIVYDIDRIAPRDGETEKGISITVGSSTFSRIFGSVRRAWLNPWIGWRLGYLYDGKPAGLAALDFGLELFRHEYFIWDLSARLGATFGKESGGSLTGLATAVSVPF